MDNIENYRKSLTHSCPTCKAIAGQACWWMRGDALDLLFHADRLPTVDTYAADEAEMQQMLETLKDGTPVHEPSKEEFNAAVLDSGLI